MPEATFANWHFDHTASRSVKGVNLLSCLYHNSQASLPVGFHLIHKTELITEEKVGKDGEIVLHHRWQSSVTKNEIARTMVASVIAKQIPFRYILADAWSRKCP